MIPGFFDQLSKTSDKVLFYYNLLLNQFEYLSESVEAMWDTERQAIFADPGVLLTNIFIDDQEAVKLRFEKVLTGVASKIEFSLVGTDNQEKRLKIDAYPIFNKDGAITAIAGLVADVTEEAEYQEYLLEFAQKKNSVLQVVAHDMQGPLSIVKGVMALLEDDIAEQNFDELKTYTDIIYRAHDDCIKLVQEVLKDEHFKSVATAVSKERFDAVHKLKQIASDFNKSKLVKKGIKVTCPKNKIIAELDQIKFTQIFQNLITNSIKFTPPEGEIEISLQEHKGKLLVTHADTGIGIPKDLQPFLFDKNNKKALRKGLNGEEPNGIGLSIIRDLVELQGGTITFESEERVGTTFKLAFPLVDI